jgi:lipid-binding SYLF domain-containing protein
MRFSTIVSTAFAGVLSLSTAPAVFADDKEAIDANAQRALTWLKESDRKSAKLLDQAAGVLIFPDIVEMGFGVGGEFGEGLLLVDGEAVDYYATAGETYGMAPESEYKAEVIFFMTESALDDFRKNQSWKVGRHADVPVAASASDALASRGDLVGMVLSEDGPVTHLVFDGDRITLIAR